MDDTYRLTLMLRAALEEAHDAMQAFTDPEGDMPADTGEFRDLKLALETAKMALSAGTIEDVEQVAADIQRVRVALRRSGGCQSAGTETGTGAPHRGDGV